MRKGSFVSSDFQARNLQFVESSLNLNELFGGLRDRPAIKPMTLWTRLRKHSVRQNKHQFALPNTTSSIFNTAIV